MYQHDQCAQSIKQKEKKYLVQFLHFMHFGMHVHYWYWYKCSLESQRNPQLEVGENEG